MDIVCERVFLYSFSFDEREGSEREREKHKLIANTCDHIEVSLIYFA